MWSVLSIAHAADSNVSDNEGHDMAYMYKWPMVDQRAFNMPASAIDGERNLIAWLGSKSCLLYTSDAADE